MNTVRAVGHEFIYLDEEWKKKVEVARTALVHSDIMEIIEKDFPSSKR